jgi:hypothetical protein
MVDYRDEIDFKKIRNWLEKTGDFTSKKSEQKQTQLDEMESLISDKTLWIRE